MEIVIFILALVLFVSLVIMHELGHALMARRHGVVVEEFGIGFPPKAWGKKLKNGVLFTLNWLPLGGFVKLKGENDNAKGKGTYGAASLPAKAKILMAGVAVNWAVAILIFSILAVVGMPRLVENQFTIASDTKIVNEKVIVQYVGPGTPADKAGLRVGDQLVKVADQRVTQPSQVTELTKKYAGQKIAITYTRGEQTKSVTTKLNNKDNHQKGYLGIAPIGRASQRSTWSAPVVGAGLTVQLTALTFQGLGSAVGNLVAGAVQSVNPNGQVRQNGHEHLQTAGDNVAGPIGIFILLKEVSSDSILLMLYLIGVISLTLAVMNALPIPALDGGRLFVTLLYRLRHKELTKEMEEKIHGYGFAVLLALVALISLVDVKRFF